MTTTQPVSEKDDLLRDISNLGGSTSPICAIPGPNRGRPREFDAGVALDAALEVFWCRGFEGASLAELTAAIGITRPSLYACFGNKEALFRKAFDRYGQEKLAYVNAALAAPTARAVAHCLLEGALDMQKSDGPKGCLGMHASIACGTDGEGIRADVIAHRAASDAALRKRFERAKTDGDLPENVDPAGLASVLSAILMGMNAQAKAGEYGRVTRSCRDDIDVVAWKMIVC